MAILTPLEQWRQERKGIISPAPIQEKEEFAPARTIRREDDILTPLERWRQEREAGITPVVEKPVVERIPLWRKAGRSFVAGWGDALSLAGKATGWIGAKVDRPQWGGWARETGEAIQKEWGVVDYDAEFADFDFRDMLNPNFLATRVPRAIPFMVSLLPAAVVGAGTVKYGAVAATATGITRTAKSLALKAGVPEKIITKVSPFGRKALEYLGAATGMRGMEGAMIAGDVYFSALERGDTAEEAIRAGNQAFTTNLPLLGTDATQVFLAFSPLGKGRWFTNTFARRIMTTGAKLTGVGLLEAGEEAYQEVIRKRALGEEIEWWGPRMKESAAVGFLMGLGFGGVGGVYQHLIDRTTKNLPSEVQQEIEERLEGLPPKEADTKRVIEIEKLYEKPTPEALSALEITIDELIALGREADADTGLEVDAPVVVEKPVVEPVKEEAKYKISVIRDFMDKARKFYKEESFIKSATPAFKQLLEDHGYKTVADSPYPTLEQIYKKAHEEPAIKLHPEIKPKVEPKIEPAIPKELEPFAAQSLRFETAESFADAVMPQLERYQKKAKDMMAKPDEVAIAEAVIPLLKDRKKLMDFYDLAHRREKTRRDKLIRREEEVVPPVVKPRSRKEQLLENIKLDEKKLRERYKKVGTEMVNEKLSEIWVEMDVAEKGERFMIRKDPIIGPTEYEFIGKQSTFPQWVSPELRRKDLFNKIIKGLHGIESIKYPGGRSLAQRELYDMILNELDSRLGIDTSKIRVRIMENYENIRQKEVPEGIDRRPPREEERRRREEKEIKVEEVLVVKAKPPKQPTKMDLFIKDKYPFATREQRRKLFAVKPAIAEALSHDIEWDKLEPIQQYQIEWSVKQKRGVPIEVLLDVIQKKYLFVPEKFTRGVKYDGPVKDHFVKIENMPQKPEEVNVPTEPIGGEVFVPVLTKFIGDLNLKTFEKSLPTAPETIRDLQQKIATEKQKLLSLFREKRITKAEITEEFNKLDRVLRISLNKLGIATRMTKKGNIIPALSKGGYGVSVSFFEGAMKDIPRIDKYYGDYFTNANTIDQSVYGLFHRNVTEPTLLFETARDRIISLYLHKLCQIAAKHEVLFSSNNKKSKAERETLAKLSEVIGDEEMKMTTDEILKLDKIKEITNRRNLVEFVKESSDLLREIRDTVNIFRKKDGLEPIGHIAGGYFPHMQETNSWFELFGLEKRIEDIKDNFVIDFLVPNQKETPHAKVRKWRLKTYNMDYRDVAFQYIKSLYTSMFNTMIIRNAKIHTEVMREKNLPVAASWLETQTAQSYAGIKGPIDKIISEISPRAYRALSWYRQALMRMVFPFNIGWALTVQPASMVITLGRMRPKHLAKGFHNWFFTKKDTEKINQMYVYIKKNQPRGDVVKQDIDDVGIEKNFIEKGVLERWEDIGSIVLRFIERHTVGWSISAAYSKYRADGVDRMAYNQAIQEGKTKKEATIIGERALDYAAGAEGAFTQSMYNHSMRPLILQNRTLTATMPFQTFAFQLFNLVKEVGGITGQKRVVADRLAIVLYVLAGALLWDEFVERVAGRRIWNWQSAVPFASGIWSPFDRDRSPFSFVATGNTFLEAMDLYLETGDFTLMRRALTRYGTAAVKIAGGLQMNRVIDASIANYKGGVYKLGHDDDKIRIAIEEPEEKVRALIFGPWSTKRGQEYWKLEDDPGLATKAYNWIIGKQPVSYIPMKNKIINHIRKKGFKNMTEVRNCPELREMIAEFNIEARERYHRRIFVQGTKYTPTEDEYFKELRRRTINYDDVKRWFKLQ